MISRRRLLWGTLGVVGVAVIGVGAFGKMGIEAEIVAVLRRRLSYLKLDEGGLHAFAKDQASAVVNKKIPTWNRLRYHFMSAVSPSWTRYYSSFDTRSRITRTEDTLIQNFLLSTDFFLNGGDETRTIGYVAYYDPMRPCQNPFARSSVSS
jgi:hypothetical protein